ncbi:MAG: 23S rRNA (pseudouridine(1915)-N(3))-methyltransferase RlmH [Bacillota bacterium]|nr:23S rRNA (pseudouridine(1915)-N(3))-methyltransferase RlmH [Bacillota bacterium]
MNIKIICVGSLKEKFYRDACGEYIKRLGRFGKISVTEINEVPGNGIQNVEKEGKLILNHISKGSYVISLCIEGKQLSSIELSEKIEALGVNGFGDITFIIGGSDGLSEDVKSASGFCLSFSKMTFPHQLMRVILLEQIYRAFTIIEGTAYHK